MTQPDGADTLAQLRERIAEALMAWAEGNNDPKYAAVRRPETVTKNAYSRADAVLAVVQPEMERLRKAERADDAVPMSREELEETVASTICCHTRMSPAVQWEIDLLMGAIDKHVALVLKEELHLIDGMRQNNLDAAATAVQRAEEAEAALARVREYATAWAALQPADLVLADAGRCLLAALNAPSPPAP